MVYNTELQAEAETQLAKPCAGSGVVFLLCVPVNEVYIRICIGDNLEILAQRKRPNAVNSDAEV